MDALSDSLTLKLICENIIKDKNISFNLLFDNSSRPFKDYTDRILYSGALQPLNRKKEKEPKPLIDKKERKKKRRKIGKNYPQIKVEKSEHECKEPEAVTRSGLDEPKN